MCASEHEFTWWSERDVLTQIPNRALTVDRLENAIAMARRHGTRIAVLLDDATDAAGLIARADAAMRVSKRRR